MYIPDLSCFAASLTPFFSEISAGGQSSSPQEDLASQAKNSSGSFFGEEDPWLLHAAIGSGRFQSEWVKMDEHGKVDGMLLWNRIWMEFGWNLNVGTCVCVCVFEELGPVIYDHIITRCSGEYPDRPLWWCLYGPSWGCLIFRKGFKDMKIKKHGPPIGLETKSCHLFRCKSTPKESKRKSTQSSIRSTDGWNHRFYFCQIWWSMISSHTCMNMPVMPERSWNSDVFGHWIRGRWQRLSVSIFCHLAEVLPVASRLWKTKIAKNGKSYVDDFIIFHIPTGPNKP